MDDMSDLVRVAVSADELRPGDDAMDVVNGRFTVASVEPAMHGMVTVTASTGWTRTVSRGQLFFRFERH
jgi:hypothetical protein